MITTLTFMPACGPVHGGADGDVIRATGIPYATAGPFTAPVPATAFGGTLARCRTRSAS